VSLSIRQAREEDLPAIARVGSQAFPKMDAQARLRELRENPRVRVEDILVAEEEGELRGIATVYPMTVWWSGVEWPAGGLASVAVAPEARRRGVARRLCESAVDRLRERNVPICLLYPFDHRFYTALGWTLVGLSRHVSVGCASLPRGGDGRVVWLDLAQRAEEIQACHSRWLQARGVGLPRHPAVWTRLFRERWQWFGVQGGAGLDGHMAIAPRQTADELVQNLEVGELVGLTPEAHAALFAALRDQEAQIDRVELALPFETPVEFLLENPRAHGEPSLSCGVFACSRIGTGAMVRVLDWTQLMAGAPPRRHTLRQTLLLALRGGPQWRLNQEGQWLEVDQDRADITVSVDEPTLTQIIWGALSLSQAVAWGRAEIRGSVDLRAIEPLFSQPSLFIPRWDSF
jgi:predicted acetyltransferase